MDISNRTLAIFLVCAIVISLASTFLSLNRLETLPITGHAVSAAGNTYILVNSTTAIKFDVASVNWSIGRVNSTGSQQNCTMNTMSANSVDCISFLTVSTPLIIENTGNTNITLLQFGSNATAAQFIGGGADHGGPQFMYVVGNNASGSCSANLYPTTFINVNITGNEQTICTNYNSVDGLDTMNISLKINIPISAVAGQKYATLTITAT